MERKEASDRNEMPIKLKVRFEFASNTSNVPLQMDVMLRYIQNIVLSIQLVLLARKRYIGAVANMLLSTRIQNQQHTFIV